MHYKITGKIALITVTSLALASGAFAGGHGGKGASKSVGRGNSAFGHRQGNPATRTTGSQNSQYGKDRAAAAKPTPTPTPSS